MSLVRLSKLEATGNDFLVVNTLANPEIAGGWTPAQVNAVCTRRVGLGADGLILMGHGTDGADVSMRLYNADGGRAQMSGNGIRGLAWLAHGIGLGGDTQLVVDTDAGRRQLDLVVDPKTDDVVAATVDMGAVVFDPRMIPLNASSAFDLEVEYHGTTYRGDAAGIGNPHLVLLVDDPATARVAQHGPHIEHDPRFPEGTNVEFIAATPGRANELEMRVWERGCGETLSCGTGACAAAAVAHRRGMVDERVTVHVPGGDLVVELGPTARLGGPVRHVFDVDVDLTQFGWAPA